MKIRGYSQLFVFCLLACLTFIGCSTDGIDETSARYLGQTPPGLKAEVFAPDLVSAENSRDRDVCFSADFSEFYFTRDARIMTMRREGNRWRQPEPAPFGADFREYEACLSPDNQRLYFISRRPVGGGDKPEDYQMWLVKRSGTGWDTPERLNDLGDYYPSFTSSGMMYFTDRHDDIWRTKLVDGRMSERERLGDSVNTPTSEFNALISPDESFLIFTSDGWGDGFGERDLYISFRSQDDRWTKAKNMGLAVNSSGLEYCPGLSPDGKYLFFARRSPDGEEDIYWINAGIIDTLRRYDMDVSLGLYHAIVAEGLERTKENYARMRDEYAAYRDFDGDLLLGLTDRLLANERTGEAVAVLKLCFELHPGSKSDLQQLKLAVVENDGRAFDAAADRLRQATAENAGIENHINLLGYQMIGWGKINEAVRVLRLNTELYPESANVYDSFAEALALRGDTAGAIENYRRSLGLNPENTNASMMLEKLDSK